MGSNVITFWSRDIDRSLYLQLQRGHRSYAHPGKHLVVIDFVLIILW